MTAKGRALPAAPQRAEYVIFGVLFAAAYLLFAHPDILETARHAYILLRSIEDGDFLGFYENTLSRVYGYTYSNAAHYNIVLYLLYAVWELPLYLWERLVGAALSDTALALWCKAIGCGFYLGCAVLLRRLARALDCGDTVCDWVPLAFLLNPIAFFTVVIMGQYDSLCLFFVLLALLYYLQGKLWRFSLIMGVGLVFKFFPLFLLLPLLLLAEKRLWRAAALAASSLWLYVPTALLFAGRSGDADVFNDLMADRLFAVKFPGGVTDVSLLGILMALLCVAAWLYTPDVLGSAVPYTGLAVFGVLFLLVLWHPQWLLLWVPFLVLTTLCRRDAVVSAVLDVILAVGFLLLCFVLYPYALEGDLLDFGVLWFWRGTPYSLVSEKNSVSFYLNLIPYFSQLAPLCFYAAGFAELLFKFPYKGETLGERLGSAAPRGRFSVRLYVWGGFAAAILCVWLVPTLFACAKAIG